MTRIEVNKHAETIKEQVFHTFPYNQFIPNFQGPHADDCPGCIIEAELQILVDKIAELSPVEDIVAELEDAKRKNEIHRKARENALAIAGLHEDSPSALVEVVGNLVSEKDRLTRILTLVSDDLTATKNRIDRK